MLTARNVIVLGYFRIKVDFSVVNGGFVDVYDFETLTNTKYYYSGKKTNQSYDFTIDLVKPYHCISGFSCLSNMMHAPEVTSTVSI